ncbi:xanthine dehydrogenase family protein molybdopterin-binding subunit [bacterium SCSIO 12696]|nr:xanthine dehydrogenase family protein molybdopterin-binding subunit [bacterium SCSIO 12696]
MSSASTKNRAVTSLSRRDFLKKTGLAGGGLLLGASIPLSATLPLPVWAGDHGDEHVLNLFVRIGSDDKVHIVCHRSEMGQGIRTGTTQIVAEELCADWAKVEVVQGLADEAYGSQNTDGSRSIRRFYTTLREMGATARTLLEQAAAQVWKVEPAKVYAKNNAVHLKGSNKSLSFGELAERAASLPTPAKDQLTFKSPGNFELIGKSVPIVDMDAMLTGDTTYGQDMHLDGMLYASIERSPVVGATVKGFDRKAALAVANVKQVIEMPKQPKPVAFHPLNGVAVLADNTWAALQGRQALNVQWQLGANKNHSSAGFNKQLGEKMVTKGRVIRAKGDAYSALDNASRKVEASYRVPYLVHAPMEPPAATARVQDGRCEVWACTQTPQSTQQNVAAALGLDKSQVKVNVTLLGGGFGRKSKPDFSVEAALLAKQTGKPVKVVWSREDDIRQGYYHAISTQHYVAGLDSDGGISGWVQRTAFPSIGSTFSDGVDDAQGWELDQSFADMPFALEDFSCENHKASAHIRIGWLRSVCNIQHGFAQGSFVDELAQAAGKSTHAMWHQLIGSDRLVDLGYQYSNYGDPLDTYPVDSKRLKAVLDLVVEKSAANTKTAAGEGWGISVQRSFVAYVAVATKVKVDGNKVTVLESHAAMDAGTVVNPDRVHAQLEGSIIFGLSLALMGEIEVKDGAVVQSNFHDYPVLRIHQNPEIKTYIVDSAAPPSGVGEPGVPPVAASLTNAIFHACGKRVRDLPVNKRFDV